MSYKVLLRTSDAKSEIPMNELIDLIRAGKVGPQDKIKDGYFTRRKWRTIDNYRFFHKYSPEEHSVGKILRRKMQRADGTLNTLRAKIGDYAMTAFMFVAFFPIWLPAIIYGWIKQRIEMRKLLRGDLEEDWRRLEDLWSKYSDEPDFAIQGDGTVMLAATGPDGDSSPQHDACEFFVRRHKNSREFLLEKMKTAEPLIAAYAFKCLIRVARISREDLPEDIRTRQDLISVQNWCLADEETLQEFYEGYFKEQDFKKAEK